MEKETTIYRRSRSSAKKRAGSYGTGQWMKGLIQNLFAWFGRKKKQILGFLLFEFIFCMITGPLLLMYGPFQNVKRIVVGTFWATFRHQYVVKAFLSDEAIEKIVSSAFANNINETGPSDSSLVDIPATHSDKIEIYSIDSAFMKGKLMVVHDPMRVVLGYSLDIPNSGKTTSEIVRDFDGIAGINAGGFLDVFYAGNGGVPDGLIIHDSKLIYNSKSNDDYQQVIAINKNGVLITGMYTADDLLGMGVREAVMWGPALIINGQKNVYGDGGYGIAPRTAIGQRKTGEILLLVLDGRSGRTIGATIRDAQDILYENGAVNAANLDGGSSTTMVYKNRVINVPSDAMGERSIPTAFVVLPPIGGE